MKLKVREELLWYNLYDKLYDVASKYQGKRNKNKFINFENGLHALSKVKKYSYRGTTPSFSRLLCKKYKYAGFELKSSPCLNPFTGRSYRRTSPSRYKVFVKGFRNLFDYSIAIHSGRISRKRHMKLYRFIRKQKHKLSRILGTKAKICIINHNEEIPILHFKFKVL